MRAKLGHRQRTCNNLYVKDVFVNLKCHLYIFRRKMKNKRSPEYGNSYVMVLNA